MVKLPKQINVSEEKIQNFNENIHQELADWLNDYISNETGFCHEGFIFEINITSIEWDITK